MKPYASLVHTEGSMNIEKAGEIENTSCHFFQLPGFAYPSVLLLFLLYCTRPEDLGRRCVGLLLGRAAMQCYVGAQCLKVVGIQTLPFTSRVGFVVCT